MPPDHRATLARIKRLDELVAYLRDEMEWPIGRDSLVEEDDLFYEFTAEELGIDPGAAAKIKSIKRLKPLAVNQPWGIFFVNFEPKKLPVVILRRILGQVALKRRASANSSERAAWATDDLLFISNYGEGKERQITFAHFSHGDARDALPTLKVLGWDGLDTPLHLDAVADKLTKNLSWPADEGDAASWRQQWRSAFDVRHREAIETAKDLSARLAELARGIRDRIRTALDVESERGPLRKLMKAFKEALLHDLDEDDFASTYAQTIAYGLLSARVANPGRLPVGGLSLAMPKTNPFLKELTENFLIAGRRSGKAQRDGIDFDELGLSEVVEVLELAKMDAVLRDFGDRNPLEDPVIHFYEAFLQDYAPKVRLERGVFYTPRPLVRFVVKAIDETLRDRFGLADGLADVSTWDEVQRRNPGVNRPPCFDGTDPFVWIIDPACGTGTFLVEVVDFIHGYLEAKWASERRTVDQRRALWSDFVSKSLLPRLYGFELMMAPYAVAHMKLEVKLIETGYKFRDEDRVNILLTNTLEKPHDYSRELKNISPALARAAAAANLVKTNKRFTVVLGNPPYANKGQLNQNAWVSELVGEYKVGLEEETKLNLEDDYIKFVRWAQWNVVEAGLGVVGFVTANTFLVQLTRRRMRESLLRDFQSVSVLDLHGNANLQERAPDGGPDRNVFEVRQGIAISILARRVGAPSVVRLKDLYGEREAKYGVLLQATLGDADWRPLDPKAPNYFLLATTAGDGSSDYEAWSPIDTLFLNAISGVQTKRDHFTIHRTKDGLKQVLDDLKSLTAAQIRTKYDLGDDGRDWAVEWARADVRRSEGKVVPIFWKAFDRRWTFYTGKTKGFHAYPRTATMKSMLQPNVGLAFKRQAVMNGEPYSFFLAVDGLISEGLFNIDARGREYLAPLSIFQENDGDLFRKGGSLESNVAPDALAKLARCVGLPLDARPNHYEPGLVTPLSLFWYVYAVVHAPTYRVKYASSLCLDYPRIPLTPGPELYRALLPLGADLVALHTLQPEYPYASWARNRQVANPFEEEAPVLGGSKVAHLDSGYPRWAEGRVQLSEDSWFDSVDERTWNTAVGGYQVCEKWLKQRAPKRGEPRGRLSALEIEYYQALVRSLKRTAVLADAVDAAVEEAGGWPEAFSNS